MSTELQENIDTNKYLHIPGVKPVEAHLPEWKAKMIIDKNLKIIRKHLGAEEEKRKENEKWAKIPEWKRPLMEEKEKKQKQEQGEIERKRAEEEAERKRLAKIPEWKQAIMKRKKSSDTQSVDSEPARTENSELLSESSEEISASEQSSLSTNSVSQGLLSMSVNED